ncbi:MAG: hypothetical protein ABEJ42_01480 [Halobacteriaceae archaeon]
MGTVADTGLRLREMARQPTTFGMVLLLPPVAIEVYGAAVASFPALPGLEADPGIVGRMTGTLFAVAFLAGLLGLFQVISARSGDDRLALCGYPRSRLLATRLATMVALASLTAVVAVAVLSWRVDVAAPALAVGVLVVAGTLYGLVGVVVGTLLPRDLEGSLVLVFLADVDNALASGLFDLGGVARVSPLYHPHELFEAAVTEGTLAAGHLLPTAAYLGVLLVAAVVATTRLAGSGGIAG